MFFSCYDLISWSDLLKSDLFQFLFSFTDLCFCNLNNQMMMINHEMKSVPSFFVVFTIQIVSSLIHDNMNVLHSWEFKYLFNSGLLICTVCTNLQIYWEKRVFIHLKKCWDTHSSVVNVSRFWEVIRCLSKFCKTVSDISLCQIKFSLILHLS